MEIPAFPPLRPAGGGAAPQGGAARDEQPQDAAVARDFTALLIGSLVREMWKTVSVDGEGPFGEGGPGATIYQGLAETAFADALARNGFGPLVAAVERALERRVADRTAAEDAPREQP